MHIAKLVFTYEQVIKDKSLLVLLKKFEDFFGTWYW